MSSKSSVQCRLIDEPPQQLALLAGDLNDTAGSKTLMAIESLWKNANDRPMPTIPVAQPRRQIDFMFFRPENRSRVVEVRMLDEPVASNHRPILAVLDVLASAPIE